MEYFFENLKNNFDFFLRQHITFSRKNYTEKSEDLSDILIEEHLGRNYEISFFLPSNRRTYLENIYYLNLFDKCLNKEAAENISILDIGSKNWSYVKSEYLFFHSLAKEVILNGVELDAYRLNTKIYSRLEVAKFHSKGLSNTNYLAGDFMDYTQNCDYIIWILPFITKYPFIRWGLPLKYFNPEKMLLHAYDLLNTDGELLIINQGEEEYKIQKELNRKLDLPFKDYGEITDKYSLFKNKRFCTKIFKKQI